MVGDVPRRRLGAGDDLMGGRLLLLLLDLLELKDR